MEKYSAVGQLGSGAFGSVTKAINLYTDEVVAIKRLNQKFFSLEECLNLREVKSLRRMNHPSIIKLQEVICEHNDAFFVFEYMNCNLYELMARRNRSLLSENQIRNLCLQIFQGLAYMHQKGYFHRDLKPENLLINKGLCVKIADFGMAKEIDSRPPHTRNVSTIWYKAPEVMLDDRRYSSKIDMWAMGAIMAELFTLRPLFPGDTEADQMHKISSVIGSPSMESWANGIDLARNICYKFPEYPGINLSLMIPNASPDAIDLIRSLCSWDPCRRPTAAEALRHPFFTSCFYVPPSLRIRDKNNCASVACQQPNREYKLFV